MCLAIPGCVVELVDEVNQIAKVDVAGVRRELAADLSAPRPVLEGPARPGDFLDGCDIRPGLVVARAVPAM